MFGYNKSNGGSVRMYYFLSLLSGIFISVMIVFNGTLTKRFGVYSATVLIHIAGLLFILAVSLIKRQKLKLEQVKWYLLTGGAIGVATTVFNNVAFGRISISAILALGLLGQSITGLLIDQYGLMGMPKHPFRKGKIGGLLLVCVGIVSMMTIDFDVLAVVVSFVTGITIVVSRTINARLADQSSVYASTVYNYAIGLPVAMAVCLLLGRTEPLWTQPVFSLQPLLYAGGILGVGVVLLSNITVMKISAFYMTLLSFAGQIFSSILLDAMLDQGFLAQNLIGGVLVSAGMGVNLLLDKKLVSE